MIQLNFLKYLNITYQKYQKTEEIKKKFKRSVQFQYYCTNENSTIVLT